ncbi:MAG: hypothetical protein QM784_16575 [Polyangiaceae bacterium]
MSQREPLPLVVATTNAGKLREIGALLQGQPVTLHRPIELLGYTPERRRGWRTLRGQRHHQGAGDCETHWKSDPRRRQRARGGCARG